MKLQVAPHIESLVPYPPGKPLEELEREYGITGSIKLASNENAWGPSPKATAAIAAALANLHRYPDGSCYYLARALAEKLGVEPAELVFGNGSNEVIELLVKAFVAPGDEVVTSNPTFLMYQKLVQVQGGITRSVPLRDMHHDFEAILSAVGARTRIIFFDNPNNPTGTAFGREAFESFLDRLPENIIVVLDEAYVDFVEEGLRLDAISYLPGRPAARAGKPVVTFRTFSKAYGLAGLRVGFGIMGKEISAIVQRVRQPFNVNSLAQIGALAALEDEEHYQKTLDGTRSGREWISAEVEKLGCTPYPSQTNFFLIDVGFDAKAVYDHLLHQGVIVRPMQAYGYPTFIRITVGRPDENERFVRSLARTLRELAND